MKNALIVMALLGIAVINSTQASEPPKSPNKFNSPECTYGVDMLTDAHGWRIKFSVTPEQGGRDARLWPDLIVNGTRTTNPQAGSVMVLDAWPGNSAGHVAWVGARSRDLLLVVHTNMKIPVDWFSYGGAMFRYSCFRYQGGNTVTCVDNGKTYALKAFMAKK